MNNQFHLSRELNNRSQSKIINIDLIACIIEKNDRLIMEGVVTQIRRRRLPKGIGQAVVAIASNLGLDSTAEVIYVDGGFPITRL